MLYFSYISVVYINCCSSTNGGSVRACEEHLLHWWALGRLQAVGNQVGKWVAEEEGPSRFDTSNIDKTVAGGGGAYEHLLHWWARAAGSTSRQAGRWQRQSNPVAARPARCLLLLPPLLGRTPRTHQEGRQISRTQDQSGRSATPKEYLVQETPQTTPPVEPINSI